MNLCVFKFKENDSILIAFYIKQKLLFAYLKSYATVCRSFLLASFEFNARNNSKNELLELPKIFNVSLLDIACTEKSNSMPHRERMCNAIELLSRINSKLFNINFVLRRPSEPKGNGNISMEFVHSASVLWHRNYLLDWPCICSGISKWNGQYRYLFK